MVSVAIATALGSWMPPPASAAADDYVRDSWAAYRQRYLHADGYVIDRTRRDGEVTSEGQSYALLRAVWMRDRRTFERVFTWTERHLRRPDGLYAWLWTPREGGRIVDANSASDADQDVAFALILASKQFRQPAYGLRAAELLQAIRTSERIVIGDGWLPAAGNWATAERVVNLSYFVPYAYPYFDRVDPDGHWLEARRTGYRVLAEATGEGRPLPPDFMRVSEAGAPLPVPAATNLSERFSFDAIRVVWRLAMDCRLTRSTDACAGRPMVDALAWALRASGRLVTAYDVRGGEQATGEAATFYACLLPWLTGGDADLGAQVRQTFLGRDRLTGLMTANDRYYDANWAWFGLALADGFLTARTPALDDIATPSRR